MPSLYSSIFTALAQRVASLSVGGLPIAWPDTNFNRSGGGRYLEVTFAPNGTQRIGVGSNVAHRIVGLMQISVWWDRNQGTSALEIAGQVAAHFPADLNLTADAVRVRVTRDAEVTGPLTMPEGTLVPVTIYWECFA